MARRSQIIRNSLPVAQFHWQRSTSLQGRIPSVRKWGDQGARGSLLGPQEGISWWREIAPAAMWALPKGSTLELIGGKHVPRVCKAQKHCARDTAWIPCVSTRKFGRKYEVVIPPSPNQ